MKFAFCTCVQLGLSCIEAILDAGHSFDLLISLHDHKSKKKSGRIYLDDVAARNNIPLLKINHINDAIVQETLTSQGIDWLFIIGWSQIASISIIQSCKLGVIGAHPTLLPEGRGRAAIPWAILKGLPRTGVTFFSMDAGVDTGPILDQIVIPINENETATTLYEKVNHAHIQLSQQIFPKLLAGTLHPIPQDDTLATYWEGRKPEDGYLDFSLSCAEADRLIRATTRPYPGAYTYQGGKKYIIWSGMAGNFGKLILEFKDGLYSAMDFTEDNS